MHLAPLLIIAAVLAADALGAAPPRADGFVAALLVATLGGQAALVVIAAWVQRRTLRGIARGRGWAAVRDGDRIVRALRGAAVVVHVAACLCGWVGLLRRWTGDLVLVDELAAILPPLSAIVATWWLWAPIERRMAEWDLLGRIDRGVGDSLGVGPLQSRGSIVLDHVRSQLLLVLVPAALALGLVEAVRVGLSGRAPQWGVDLAQAGAVAAVFVASPWIVRRVLETAPLPAGPQRALLADIARRNRVGVTDLLVWRTRGALRNAAVVGFLPALRYVLLTDALLGELAPRHLAAVMAHEVAHVRHRHMLVGILSLMALSAAGGLAAQHVAVLLDGAVLRAAGVDVPSEMFDAAVLVATGAIVVVGFGWTSRRLERQADAFAAKELGVDGDGRVTAEGVDAMCGALDAVAAPNGLDATRPSYRHGSIAWRQGNLREIVGAPAAALPIDRLVRWIAIVSVVALGAAFAVDAMAPAAPIQSSLAASAGVPAITP